MTAVKEIMSQGAECVKEHDTLADAARTMARLGIGAMPICGDDQRLKGMLTDRDIVVKGIAQGKSPDQCEASELAEGTPVWIDCEADTQEAVRMMQEHKIRRLPVMEDKKLVGIVSQADIAMNGVSDEIIGKTVEEISAAPPNN